jgi:lipopolysaccharide export system permease protein
VKILDKYLLKTFLITFTSVFVILFFIFILQTVWLFIAELAGKDLDFVLILKFLLFSMPGIVPLVLPLSILLASIMTFGDLSENYEFAAMKSSGVSLQRAMKSLTFFILLLSIAAFAFANNIIPYSQYKFINFKNNIAQVKPAMAIAEGQFSDIGNYNIKVDKKSGEKGNLLTGVTIHRKSSNGVGNTTVIKAKRGELLSSEDSNILQLVLFDGYYYEDIIPKKYQERDKVPFAKSSFKRYNLNMDLSKLNNVDVEQEKISNTSTMLNISELTYTLDSLSTNYTKDISSFADNIHLRTGIASPVPLRRELVKDSAKTGKILPAPKNLLDIYTNGDKLKILDIAKSNVSNTVFSISGTKDDLSFKQKNINTHWLSVYDKFVIAYACILMFFIGAPLGAIIRKGGLGLPIVFAVLIFITFHFINTFGKKIAQENGITPFLGAWMSSLLLTPLALLLTYRATNDIGLINMDVVLEPLQKLFRKLFPQK